jgi:hypothetical protein
MRRARRDRPSGLITILADTSKQTILCRRVRGRLFSIKTAWLGPLYTVYSRGRDSAPKACPMLTPRAYGQTETWTCVHGPGETEADCQRRRSGGSPQRRCSRLELGRSAGGRPQGRKDLTRRARQAPNAGYRNQLSTPQILAGPCALRPLSPDTTTTSCPEGPNLRCVVPVQTGRTD